MQDIPVIHVEGRTLAESYERALVQLYHNGIRLPTQYDKPEDPPSIDATMNITVTEPLAEPMIHKAFPGGIEDLREYAMEIQGAKDHWVKNMNDPNDTRWEYTYHQRLARYGIWHEATAEGSKEVGPFRVDQIDKVLDKLSEQPFTRQAQMITWMPLIDLDCYDPPCLQSIWYRLLDGPDGEGGRLNCNVRFRSNDAWGASFMNLFGFTVFNRDVMAEGLGRRLGRPVSLGRLNWQADSYHIYGKDLAEAKARLFDRMGQTAFGDRVYCLSDPAIREIYDEAEALVRAKIAAHDASR
jgi:thymidylate synthase